MGAGASTKAVEEAKVEDITEALKGLSPEQFKKVQDAVSAIKPLVGKPTIHMVFRVPKDKEGEFDEYWKAHEAVMKSDHKMGTGENDLLEMYISKGMEKKDPMDASKGETDNMLYIMSETYNEPQGIAKHMGTMGEKWDGMKTLPDKLKEYGLLVQIGGLTVFTCFQDVAAVFKTPKDQATLHMMFRVPKDLEKEHDDYWKTHEATVRKTHTLGLDGDDSKAPRLTCFYIAKGDELENPMDSASAKTGNVLYVMSETYADPGGIPKHMEMMGASWDNMKTLPEKIEKYGILMDIGATKVLTTMTE